MFSRRHTLLATHDRLSRTAVVPVIATLFLVGCSLAGLEDGLEQSACEPGDTDFCESLNESNPTDDPCLRWTCGARGVCEVLPEDRDGDLSPSAACAPEGVTPDCDDSDPSRSPTADEVCDVVDNDCDGLVDEAALDVGAPVRVLSTSGTVADAHMASSPDSPGIRVLYVTEGVSAETRAASLPSATSAGGVASEVSTAGNPLSTREASLSTLGDGFAINVVPAGAPRVAAGTLDAADATAVFAGSHLQDGFVLSTTAASSPTVASFGQQLFAAWLNRDAQLSETCPLAPNDTAEVLITSARLPQNSDTLSMPSVSPTMIGTTHDPAPPAILGLSETTFLVAYANAANETVDVHLGEVIDAGSLEIAIDTPPLHSIDAPRSGDVGLSVSESGDIMLTFREGCGTLATIEARLLALADDLTGADPVTVLGSFSQSGGNSVALRNPVAVHHASRNEWLIAWTVDSSLLAISRIAKNGMPIGLPRNIYNAGDAGSIRPRPFLKAIPGGNDYAAIAHDGSGDAGFYAVTLGCATDGGGT